MTCYSVKMAALDGDRWVMTMIRIPHDLQADDDLDGSLGRCVYCDEVFERKVKGGEEQERGSEGA